MPKRNRTKEQRKQFGSAPVAAVSSSPDPAAAPKPVAAKPVDDEQTRAAKMFAESLAAHEAADRAERERVRAETEQMMMHETLKANKQRAADVIKQLRGQPGSRQRMAEAEAAYRAALAELHEFETGERPHWAPAVPDLVEADVIEVDVVEADVVEADDDAGTDESADQPV